jgi:WD40 repeat protein
MQSVLREHASCVNGVDISPDGDTFVTASCDKTIKLWSLSQRKALATLTGHSTMVDACVFIENGRSLVSLSHDLQSSDGIREVRLWNVGTRSLDPSWPPKSEVIQGLAVGRSGQTLVTRSGETAAVWKRQGATYALSHRWNDPLVAYAGILSPDEEFISLPVARRSLQTLRVRDGAVISESTDHFGGVAGMAISAAGDRLATASRDSAIRVLRYPSGKLEHCFLGHESDAWQVAWSPSGNSLASVSSDGTVRVWVLDLASEKVHLSVPKGHSANNLWSKFRGFAFLQDGRQVNAAYDGFNLTWDLQSGQCIESTEVHSHRLEASQRGQPKLPFASDLLARAQEWDLDACYIFPLQYRQVFGPVTQSISLLRFVNGARLQEVKEGKLRSWSLHPPEFLSERQLDFNNLPPIVLDLSRDGRRLCGVQTDHVLRIWRLDQDTVIPIGQIANIREAVFSPDGERILIVGDDVAEYDATTGRPIREYKDRGPLAVNYSADGQRIAIKSDLGFITIYDALTGEQTLRLETGGHGPLVFGSGRTSLVATGAPDGGFYFWPGQK